jgi:hypothetical protein
LGSIRASLSLFPIPQHGVGSIVNFPSSGSNPERFRPLGVRTPTIKIVFPTVSHVGSVTANLQVRTPRFTPPRGTLGFEPRGGVRTPGSAGTFPAARGSNPTSGFGPRVRRNVSDDSGFEPRVDPTSGFGPPDVSGRNPGPPPTPGAFPGVAADSGYEPARRAKRALPEATRTMTSSSGGIEKNRDVNNHDVI